MIYIAFNSKDTLDRINELLIDLTNNNISNNEKIKRLKEVLYIFFRVDSLVKIKKDKDKNDRLNKKLTDAESSNNENINRENSIKNDNSSLGENYSLLTKNKAILAIHKFLREKDSSDWYKILTEEAEFFKSQRDVNGLMFSIINQTSLCYMKNSEISVDAIENFELYTKMIKEKFKNSDENIADNNNNNCSLKEKSCEKIVTEMNQRFEYIIYLYGKLYDIEENILNIQKDVSSSDNNIIINNSISNNNLFDSKTKEEKTSSTSYENNKIREFNIGNNVLIKTLLNHFKNGLDNNNTDLTTRNQIELTFKLFESHDNTLNGINILEIDSIIIKTVKQLYLNLCLIFNKSLLLRKFIKYKYNVLGYKTRERYLEIKYAKNSINFKEMYYNKLLEGEKLLKINYNSKGFKEHLYILDSENKAIRIYNSIANMKKNPDNYKLLYLLNNANSNKENNNTVKKVVFGLNTENIIIKYQYIDKKNKKEIIDNYKPWLFMSFILENKSIDLYLNEEENTNNFNSSSKWFLGLRYFSMNISKIDIPSVMDYYLSKVKYKMLFRICEFYELNKDDSSVNNVKNSYFLVITKLYNYVKDYLGNYDELPFYKILCLYMKLLKEKREFFDMKKAN